MVEPHPRGGRAQPSRGEARGGTPMPRRMAVLAALVAIVTVACGGGSSASTPASPPPSSAAGAAPSAAPPATPAASVAVASSGPTAQPLPTAMPRPINMTVDGTCEPDHTCLGLLKPGKYHTKVLIPGFSFSIAEAGWENIGLAGGNVGLLSTTNPGDAIMIFWMPRATKADGTLVAGVSSDVAALGAWLEGNKDLALSNAARVSVGGLKGKRW